MRDIQDARQDFPLLKKNNRLIYFDNAATTQKPSCVLDALYRYYEDSNANIHRGLYSLAEKAGELYEGARQALSESIGAHSRQEVIFTRNTTESIHLVAFSYAGAVLRPGDNIVTTVMEHHANYLPWQRVCLQHRAELRRISADREGRLDLNECERLLDSRTRLLAVTYASHVTGIKNPLAAMISMAHRRGIPVLVDGAQCLQHEEVSLAELDCDFFCFSGHKVYGPTGIGVLYGKRALLERAEPFMLGGGMVRSINGRHIQYEDLPYRFEAGTPNIAGAVALAEAFSYLRRFDPAALKAHESALIQRCIQSLSSIKGVRVIAPEEDRIPLVSFFTSGVNPFDVSTLLDMQDICVRSGTLCAKPAFDALGLPGVIRLSPSFCNTLEEADRFCLAVKAAMERLSS